MSEKSPSPVLSHLNSEQIDELIARYYKGDNIAALIKEFDLSCKPVELYRRFPPEQLSYPCPACGAFMVSSRLSRSNSNSRRSKPGKCSVCMHQDSTWCQCSHCTPTRTKAFKKMLASERAAIEPNCGINRLMEPVSVLPEQLSADAAVSLLTLIRCGGWLSDSSVGPLSESSPPFAPRESALVRHMLASVLNYNLVTPSCDWPTSAFQFEAEIEPPWKQELTQWTIQIYEARDFIQRLELLIASDRWPESWNKDLHAIWKRLAVAECWEFCAYSVAKRSLPMPGTTALMVLFDNLLRDYSVSQCYQLIWNAASRAVDFMVRERTKPQHAANSIIGNCQRYADHARVEGWKIKGFQRNFDLPRSQLSHVLHDVFFKHGDLGFHGVISSGIY